jgi:hypothetical protein
MNQIYHCLFYIKFLYLYYIIFISNKILTKVVIFENNIYYKKNIEKIILHLYLLYTMYTYFKKKITAEK